MKVTADLSEDLTGSSSKPLKDEARKYGGSKEAISSKYAVMREQSKQVPNQKLAENIVSAKVSLLDAGSSQSGSSNGGQSGLASRWASMKAGFQTIKANMGSKKFLPLRQVQETQILSRALSSESLDEIFQRLKRPSAEHGNHSDEDEDEDGMDIRAQGPTR